MNIVYNKNYLDVMPKYSNCFFDLAYLDPQYGIKESSKNHKSRNTPIKQKNGSILKAKNNNYQQENWDNNPPCDDYFNQIFRISKNQLIFGGNYFKQIVENPFSPPRRKDFDDFLKKYPKGWIIWDKLNGKNDFNDCELIYTSFDFESFVLPYLWNGMMQGISIRHGSVQRGDKSLNEKRIHPTQKPMPLNYFLLEKFTKNIANPKIFDAGVGSGGSRIACYDLGYYFEGCEISEDMFLKQENKFQNHIQNLFIVK